MKNLWLPAAFVAAGFFLAARSASAHEQFPTIIAEHLDVQCAPGCDLCHLSKTGGDTIVRPFAFAMLDRGLDGANEATVIPALDKMTADKVDSNCDGVIDTDALAMCEDPNEGSERCPTTTQSAVANYGCSASPAPASAAAATVTALALVALRTRKKRSRARP